MTDALESSPGFVTAVLLMLIGYTAGLITLGVALARARRLPVWVGIAMACVPVTPAVAGGKVPVTIGFLLLFAGFAMAARVVGAGAVPAPTTGHTRRSDELGRRTA